MRRKLSLDSSFAIFGVVIFCVLLFSGQDVCADGKHFPEKAFKQAPAIPSQRAILSYRDGIEKLTIESALEGKGREFGWVIPLPSKPTEFEKTSPGLIRSFSLVLQPEIVHRPTMYFGALLFGATFIILAYLIFIFTKSTLERIGLLFMLVFIFGFVSILCLGGAKSEASTSTDVSEIKVHDIRHVGSYELAVLETKTSQALDTWLESNGFTGLSEEDEKIVSDYIKDKWYFVAAKLHRQGDGYSRPHPLSMTFATEKPVYPMRLTATVGSNVYLELYVIADRQATCEVLTLEVSDMYRFYEERKSSYSSRTLPSGFGGETYGQSIGHSDAAKFMWDGCFLSKLCGTLKPKQMGEDIILRLKRRPPRQGRYYSRRGARYKCLESTLRIWCILPILLTVVYHYIRKKPSGKCIFVTRILTPSVLISFMVCILIYSTLPKTDVYTSSGSSGAREKQHMMAAELAHFGESHDDFTDSNKDEIAELVAGYFESNDTPNVYTSEPIEYEDSPGDYTIIEDERGVLWRTYSQGGYPIDYVLKPARED